MKDRLRAHLLAQLVCLGRHTLTGLLATNGQLQSDWSADYRLYSRQRMDAAELFGQIRRGAQQSLAAGEALTVAMDDSILRNPRCSDFLRRLRRRSDAYA
jgi:hypothetical protein